MSIVFHARDRDGISYSLSRLPNGRLLHRISLAGCEDIVDVLGLDRARLVCRGVTREVENGEAEFLELDETAIAQI